MVKNHIKKLTVPRSWITDKKSNKYIIRPNAGAHPFELGVSINMLFKDMLRYCKTSKEVKSILKNKEVLVDGKRRYDHRYVVGFMDVLSIPSIKEQYIIFLNKKGKLVAQEIKKKDSEIKISKIINKKLLGKNKIQINLNDGRNIILKKDEYKVGDSLVLTLPKQEVKEHIRMDKGAFVMIIGGKYKGSTGTIEEIKENLVMLKTNGKDVKTIKRYVFVIGDKKPIIDISGNNEQNEGNKSS